jgi:hypothetical protein
MLAAGTGGLVFMAIGFGCGFSGPRAFNFFNLGWTKLCVGIL